MENLAFYLIFILICFLILGVAIKLFPKDSIFTIAIGSVIGSNIYNSISYPVRIFGITFGIDSIVYTLFIFCILVMYIDHGEKDFKTVLYTSLFSIFFTAFLYFMGTFTKTGFTTSMLLEALSYINSIIGTYIAAIVMIKVFDFLKNKNLNIYLNIFINLILASIINSFIYFSLTFLSNHTIIKGFFNSLLGSYLGKLIASGLCLIIFLLHKTNFKNKANKDKLSKSNTNEIKSKTKSDEQITLEKNKKISEEKENPLNN